MGLFLLLPLSLEAQTTDYATDFTYQGYLEDTGMPVNDTCDMQFTLYDALTLGNVIGKVQTITNIAVSDGIFTVMLDFEAEAFDGIDHYLEIAIDCKQSGNYATLSPRQAITPAPYALGMYGLRTIPNATSPNIIGGRADNFIISDAAGATISGGGSSANLNRIFDNYGTIGGGSGNQAGTDDAISTNAQFTTIGGGFSNDAIDAYSTVGGGRNNIAAGENAIVSGGFSNDADGMSATVGGGSYNDARVDYTTIGGGWYNEATADSATIGGGFSNQALGSYSTVAGGGLYDLGDFTTNNAVFDDYGTIGGGANNKAGSDDGTSTNDEFTTISGGANNQASANSATVGGGSANQATGPSATVSGGFDNEATSSYATISGGEDNEATSLSATVGGGSYNQANGLYSTIGGGFGNDATGRSSAVSGGSNNSAIADNATVSGGASNSATANYAMIPGGDDNAANGNYSFAAGRRAIVNGQGSFVWADSNDFDYETFTDNEFAVRATGGVAFVTGIDVSSGAPITGVKLAPGSGSWAALSDRNTKENFASVDSQAVLAAVAEMPLTSWNYITQDDEIRHMGVMAQDFYAAFGLGGDETRINTIDADGVLFASIQGLHAQVVDLQAMVRLLMAVVIGLVVFVVAQEIRLRRVR